jgi:hypothetical protein
MASSRRAHQVLGSGLPSVESGLPLLSHYHHNVKSIAELRRGRHFNGLWAATSKGRHLSKRGAPPKAHMLISKKIFTQSNPIKYDIVPFDLLIDFAFKFSPFLSPFILFLF